MAKIIAGVSCSHVPAIGAAIDNGKTEEPYWKRVFSGFEKSKEWMAQAKPDVVIATGQKHLNNHEDVAYLTIYFGDSTIAHINVNWLSPVKVRTTLLGGEKKMLMWNDLEADEKVKIYDKGVDITSGEGVYDLLVSYRSGDMWAPKVEQVEALKMEAAYFVDCIMNDKTPFNDGVAGLHVVRMLEAADQSLQQKGKIIQL